MYVPLTKTDSCRRNSSSRPGRNLRIPLGAQSTKRRSRRLSALLTEVWNESEASAGCVHLIVAECFGAASTFLGLQNGRCHPRSAFSAVEIWMQRSPGMQGGTWPVLLYDFDFDCIVACFRAFSQVGVARTTFYRWLERIRNMRSTLRWARASESCRV